MKNNIQLGTDLRIRINDKFVDAEVRTKVISKPRETLVEVEYIYHIESEEGLYNYNDAIKDLKSGINVEYAIENCKTNEVEEYGKASFIEVVKIYADNSPVMINMKLLCE